MNASLTGSWPAAGSWYVAQTHARAEQLAVRNLERQGFRTYLPRYLKRRRHARKTELVSVPLFPRYLFVNFDLQVSRWRAILSTFGVSQLVSAGDRPLALPEGVVEEIHAREDADGMVEVADQPLFAEGQMVKITAGPMRDHIGLFNGLSDRDRVFVLLDLLGRQLKVKVPGRSVAAYV